MSVDNMYKSIQEVIPHLKVGDVIMMRNRSNAYSRKIIRDVNHTYWTHSSMVFDILKTGNKIESVMLIEMNEAIEVHRLETYTAVPEDYDLGVFRVKEVDDEMRERIRGFYLRALDLDYDYSFVFSCLAYKLVKDVIGYNAVTWLANRWKKSHSFICTTFTQLVLYLAAAPGKRRKMLFRGHQKGVDYMTKFTLVSPRDISTAKNIDWLYNKHI